MPNSIPEPSGPFDLLLAADALTRQGIWPWLEQWFFLPGDWLLWALLRYAPPLARMLELSVDSYGGVFSGCWSGLVWLAVLAIFGVTVTAIRDFDRAVTSRIDRLYREAARRTRLTRNLLGYRFRRARTKLKTAIPTAIPIAIPTADQSTEASEEIEVGTAELRILHAHAELEPGYALSLSDIATAVGARRYDVQRVLTRLVKLNLLRATLGGGDGENAYTLTAAGTAFLTFRRATAKNPRAAALRAATAQSTTAARQRTPTAA